MPEVQIGWLISKSDLVVNPIIIGDMNVRLGDEQQSLNGLQDIHFHAGLLVRNSMDKTLNTNGKKYLDFCNSYGLVILNGRTVGDSEGNYTFLSTNGSSVNDVCAVSIDMLQYVEMFEVGKQIWSDHLPVRVKLQLNSTYRLMEKLNLLPKLNWNSRNLDRYKRALNEHLGLLQDQNEHIRLADLNNLIIKSYGQPRMQKKQESKQKWFDRQCGEARDVSMNSLNKYRSTNSPSDKQQHMENQKQYDKICKKKRRSILEG